MAVVIAGIMAASEIGRIASWFESGKVMLFREDNCMYKKEDSLKCAKVPITFALWL